MPAVFAPVCKSGLARLRRQAEKQKKADLAEQQAAPEEKDWVAFGPIGLLVYLCVVFGGACFLCWKLYSGAGHPLYWASYGIVYIALAFGAGVDLKNHIVPNELFFGTLGLQTIVLVLQSAFIPGFFPRGVMQAAVCFLVVLAALFLLSKIVGGGLGLGDVKLLAATGYCLGFISIFSILLYSVFLSFFAALFFLLVLKKGRKYAIPFAPFIFIGFLLTVGLGA